VVTVTGDDVHPAGEPRERRPRHIARLWLVILAVLAGAVGMVVLSAVMAPERQHDIWVEMAKSSAQVIVLVLATGVVAAMLRDRDALREEQRRHQAQLLAFLDQVETVYSLVRTARRMLRTYGFDSAAPMILSAEQATGFRTQLALLNEAQLAFEIQSRKVAALPGLWGTQRSALAGELTTMSDYLQAVIREWETDPTVMVAGGDASAITGWPSFQRFVGYEEASVGGFQAGIVDRMLSIEGLVRESDRPAPVHALLARGDHATGSTGSPDSKGPTAR
jgi:hypothetical protein